MERRENFGPLTPNEDCNWRRGDFLSRISTRRANSHWLAEGVVERKNIRLLRAFSCGVREGAISQSISNEWFLGGPLTTHHFGELIGLTSRPILADGISIDIESCGNHDRFLNVPRLHDGNIACLTGLEKPNR